MHIEMIRNTSNSNARWLNRCYVKHVPLSLTGRKKLLNRRQICAGFSLIELLIVISIIGLLLQLALPAVEMARESARKVSCVNNLRQIGLASQLHHDAHGFYPSGGWFPTYVGDPLRGFGKKQPGGWVYSTLPYLEQNALYRMPDDGNPDEITQEQKTLAVRMIATPLSVFQCPSRRLAKAYPYIMWDEWDPRNSDVPTAVARSDYAANGGDFYDDDFPFFLEVKPYDSTIYSSIDAAVTWAPTEHMNGVCFLRSEVAIRQVTDGVSNTYLVGEKYLIPAGYKNGADPGDNLSMYRGFGNDIVRWADRRYPPMQDSQDVDGWYNFGSVHPNAFHMVFCGGTVKRINYAIDLDVHKRLANRCDGEPTPDVVDSY